MEKDSNRLPALPSGHPRIYLRPEQIPDIRRRLTERQNEAAYRYYLSCLEETIDGHLPPVPEGMARPTNSDFHLLGVMECYAFAYLLEGDTARARSAIEGILDYHASVVHYDYNTEGQEIFTLGLVYDWCYDCLTDGEKEQFFRAAEETASRMEMGYPVFRQGFVTGHGVEGQLMRDLMTAAVAMADEKPGLYEHAAGLFFSRIIEPKKLFYESGTYPQGTHYLTYRMEWELLATQIWEALGVPRVFGDHQTDPLFWFLYLHRPDGTLLYDGDDHKNNKKHGVYYCDGYRSLFHGSNLSGNPYLKQEAMREMPFLDGFRERGNQSLNAVEFLIFNRPELSGKPFDSLPLSRYFPGIKGEMVARTGWQDGSDAPVAVAQMKINCLHTANHQHLDGGAFQLYYKGYLATDSGYYQAFRNSEMTPESGNTNYGSAHFFNYYRRTVAHNSMLVRDPGEQFSAGRGIPGANDGGQRYPNDYREAPDFGTLTGQEFHYRVGEVLAHGVGPDPVQPDYTYLKGDLAPAYSEKVAAFERSFLFLNLKNTVHPAVLIIHDRVVSSDPSFRKTWLLHTLEHPEETGTGCVARDTRPGYGGQLSLGVLLPERENRTLTFIGGEGHEHETDGVNYCGRTLDGDHMNEGGGWRTELSPVAPEAEDTFLTVLQMADGGTPDLPISRLDADTHIGALVGDRLALFARKPGKVAALSFVLPGETPVLVTAADLLPGVWQYGDEKLTVDAESGIAYFTAQPGENVLSLTDGIPETPHAEPVEAEVPAKTETTFGLALNGELLRTDASSGFPDHLYADPSSLIRKLGLTAETRGATLLLSDGTREVRLPIREKNGIPTVSVSGFAAAFSLGLRADRFARIVYLSGSRN